MQAVIPVALLGFVGLAAGCAGAAPRACADLTQLRLDGAEITAATEVPAGRFTPPADGIPMPPFDLPAYCRVEAVARPTADSEIKFEVWLPAEGWNGKFQQVGNGGYAGSIPSASIGAALLRGYAAAGTDDGHVGQDPSFAIGHPEKVIDFGHRAVHLTAEFSKAIIAARYGEEPKRSYFVGCSDGGREALMEAQRYPADFDGIVAGAPANNWTRLMAMGVWDWQALTETPGSAIPAAKLGLIQAAALAACDGLDDVADGLIENPSRCRFNPERLRCPGGDRPDCLTGAQLAALEKLYSGPVSPATGERIHPGAVPGAEAVPGNWNPWMVASEQMPISIIAWFGTGFFRDMVFAQADWDYRTFDFDQDLATALGKVAPHLDATDPDLRPFRDRGGKLIQYHGWGDAAIPATGSVNYYQEVLATVGPDAGDFYRLFMVPGMGHCGDGIGPTDFGQALPGPDAADPERDIVAALDRWVEQGTAPEQLIGTGLRLGDPPSDPAKTVAITRPICAWPKEAVRQGNGSTDEAASFTCAVRDGK
ncbi:MAG: tannase/feruloyl esterase family alpha/beta hydrolase [Gemmatimonadales bacterium]